MPFKAKRGKVEREVLKDCLNALSLWERRGVVVHFDRINSGAMHMGDIHLRLAKKGTPDIFAFCDFKGVFHVLFIECKRERGGTWTYEQQEFARKFAKYPNAFYIVCRDKKEIDDLMEMNSEYSVNQFKDMDKHIKGGN